MDYNLELIKYVIILVLILIVSCNAQELNDVTIIAITIIKIRTLVQINEYKYYR